MTKVSTLVLSFFMGGVLALEAQDNTKGYYKDLFVDGGIFLTSRNDLPAARFMNLSMECFLCSPQEVGNNVYYNHTDSLLQEQLFGGSPLDENGILLYPDGQPRFRLLYTNGGRSWKHARTIGQAGSRHVNDYIKNGGSYVGTCAGAFIASKAVVSSGSPAYLNLYYGIWPGYTCHTGLGESTTTIAVEKKSPLLKYFSFGKDMKIDSVRHNGGGFAVIDSMYPEGTEILARYDISDRNFKLKRNIQGMPAIWAQKESHRSGRVIMCGSHPEYVTSGERMELMCAMVKYALDGNGKPRLKAELVNGKTRNMFCETSDKKPEFTRIGDRQYHHFSIKVPEGAKTLTVSLQPKNGYNNYDLFLLAAPDHFAYLGDAAYKDLSPGVGKELVVPSPKPGVYYISVYCNTTVNSEHTLYGTRYTGRLDVLNGVPYSITAEIHN